MMGVRITAKPSFFLYLLLVYVFASWESCAGLLTALTVHELAHLLVAMAIKEAIDHVEITPFGGVITYKAGHYPSKGVKGLVLAAAGPAGNYLFILGVSMLLPDLQGELLRQVLIANLSMLMINLLPVLPLDGGTALFSIGYYLFDVAWLIKALCALGVAAGTGLCVLGLWGWAQWGRLNVSLLVVGGYITVCALQSRERMIAENMYAVIQERRTREAAVRPISLYAVPREERICSLLQVLSRSPAAVFVIEDRGRLCYFTEAQVCAWMMDTPYAQIADILEKHAQKEEKSCFYSCNIGASAIE